jgi:hypothetical protein
MVNAVTGDVFGAGQTPLIEDDALDFVGRRSVDHAN